MNPHPSPRRSWPRTALAATLALILTLTALLQTQPLFANSGKITGTVTAANGSALPNISVVLYREQPNTMPGQTTSWSQVQTVTTNSSGYYEANYLPTAIYRVQFRDPAGSYASTYYPNAATITAAADVSVPGTTVNGIDAVLGVAGRITGVVRDTTGQGLGGTTVTAYQLEGTTWVAVASTTSSYGSMGMPGMTMPITGSYQLGSLTSGTYRVGVNDTMGGSRFLPRFYLNASTVQSATDVSVTAGQATANIDIEILPFNGKISGTVYKPDGTPLAGVQVSAYRCSTTGGTASCGQTVSTSTSTTGAYTLQGLSPAEYKIGFRDFSGAHLPEFYNDVADLATATPFSVTVGTALTGIDATLGVAGRITGVVRDPAGVGLGGTIVTAYRLDGTTWVAVASTTSSYGSMGMPGMTMPITGSYQLGSLTSGTYRVGVNDAMGGSRFLPHFYLNATTVQSATDVSVTVGQVTANIDIEVPLFNGKISGTVYKPDGTPLAGASVSAYRCSTMGSSVSCGQTVSTSTSTTGAYTLQGLSPAEYKIGFRDPAGAHLPEFYNDAADLATATPVSVTVGTTLTGIDATLAVAGRITGMIRNPAGVGLGGASVSVYRLTGATWVMVDGATSSYGSMGMPGMTMPITGSYQIGGLTSGTYRVGVNDMMSGSRFLPRFYLNATTVQSATDVLVTAGQATPNIDIQFGSGGKIMGHVYGPNSAPLQGIKIDLYRNYYGQMWRLVYTTTSNDGAYLIAGLEDSTYKVRFSDPQGVLATEYYNDAPDMPGATPVVIANSNVVPNVDATLETAGAVSGTVTNASTTPLSGTLVTAYRQTSAGWEAFGNTTTAANGTYSLGLRAGTYRVYFFDPSGTYAYEYFNNKFKLSEATDVTVTSGATSSNINAVLDPPVPPIAQVTTNGSVTSDPHTGIVTVGVTNAQRSDTTVSTAVMCNSGSPANVALWLGAASYPMVETPAGSSQYQATVPAANLASGALEVRWTCAGVNQTKPLGTIVLYDPSGRVTNAVTNQPIKNAVVTLYHVPGWRPRTSPMDSGPNTCESGASKMPGSPWSQAAPTSEGVLANPDTGTIDPKANPLRTDAQGAYGWNVAQGCWYIVVQAQGYQTKVSPVVGVPPAVTDLHMALTPTGSNVSNSGKLFLPLVRR